MSDIEERLREEIAGWEQAYPLSAFPEPDLARAAEVLKADGMTLDAISASNMRHVVSRLAPQIHEAVDEIARLSALAKANNQLARINGDHRDEWRAKAVTLAEALEPFAEAQWTGLRSAEPGTPLDERDVFEVDGLKIGDFNRARAALACDSGRLPQGEDSRSEAECEASQNGAEGNRPTSTGDHP
jgi:hypothetical protein